MKEVRLSERQQGQNDNEEEADPVSEITDEVSKGSRGGEEVLYSDTFSDLSSSFTSRSPDCSVERPSRTSRSSERQKSTRKLFKDAVVQTQLALPTSRWTSGQWTSPDTSLAAAVALSFSSACRFASYWRPDLPTSNSSHHTPERRDGGRYETTSWSTVKNFF